MNQRRSFPVCHRGIDVVAQPDVRFVGSGSQSQPTGQAAIKTNGRGRPRSRYGT